MHRLKWEWDSITTFNQFVASFIHPLRSKMSEVLPMEKVWNPIPYPNRQLCHIFQEVINTDLAEQSGLQPKESNPVASSETIDNRWQHQAAHK
jgi:hypothetical protein